MKTESSSRSQASASFTSAVTQAQPSDVGAPPSQPVNNPSRPPIATTTSAQVRSGSATRSTTCSTTSGAHSRYRYWHSFDVPVASQILHCLFLDHLYSIPPDRQRFSSRSLVDIFARNLLSVLCFTSMVAIRIAFAFVSVLAKGVR